MSFGNILLIVTLVSSLLIIIATPFTKKIRNNYWFWAIIGIFCFLYVFFGRQIRYIVPSFASDLNMSKSLKLSRILLLDMCPFYAIFGSLSLLLKNKTTAKILAPFGFYGAVITIFGQIIFAANNVSQNLYWEYIFVGIDDNQLYFMMHYLSLVLSLIIIFWMTDWRRIMFLYCNAFAFFYFSYVIIMVGVNNDINSNTTGVLPSDWDGGEYYKVKEILDLIFNTDLPIYVVMILGYSLSYLIISFIFWIRYYLSILHIFLYNKYYVRSIKKIKQSSLYIHYLKTIKKFKMKFFKKNK